MLIPFQDIQEHVPRAPLSSTEAAAATIKSHARESPQKSSDGEVIDGCRTSARSSPHTSSAIGGRAAGESQKPADFYLLFPAWCSPGTTHALAAYRNSKSRLLSVPFESVTEYLFLWREILDVCRPLSHRLVVCACAAVADFYIPAAIMPTHKLDSRVTHDPQDTGFHETQLFKGSSSAFGDPMPHSATEEDILPLGETSDSWGEGRTLQTKALFAVDSVRERDVAGMDTKSDRLGQTSETAAKTSEQMPHRSRSDDKCQMEVQRCTVTLKLAPVPKMLGLAKQIIPECFFISFKLETDPKVLAAKAVRSMRCYGADIVVGNLLESRHQTVTVFCQDATLVLRASPAHVASDTADARREAMPPTARRTETSAPAEEQPECALVSQIFKPLPKK